MGQKRSFTEYVEDKFYNQMFEAISSLLQSDIGSLNLYSRVVQNIKQSELEDIKVKAVFASDDAEMKIAFDVIVEAEIEVKDSDRHNDYDDSISEWFMLSCSGDLSCCLSDFKIEAVEAYNKKKFREKPLSDALIPYIAREDLERCANEFLQRYYAESLRQPTYVDPMILAQRMGVDVKLVKLHSDLSIFGAAFFKDCDTEYFDDKIGEMMPLHVKSGTILVDPMAYYLRNLGSVNNTIIHECVHWHFHRKAFSLEHLYNKSASQIKCQVLGGIKNSDKRGATDWMEWQANSLAPRIQMPLVPFKQKAQELIRKYRADMHAYEVVDVMEPVIRELATFFGVSNIAAKIRLIDAGYNEALGVMTYIDGRYIKPHYFKKDSISKSQTFSISIQDALIESVVSPQLRDDLAEGKYKYIDSHFVFNNPKYIELDDNKVPQMTEYARLHVDECCVIFDLKVKSVNKYGEQYYTECVLFRDSESNITFEAKYSPDNKSHTAQAKQFQSFRADVLGLIKTLPNDFPGALKKVFEWSEMTEEELAEAADLSTRSIQRYLNDDTQNPTMETMIQLCIGMRLPSMVAFEIIEKSGNKFKSNDLHFVYKFILMGCESQPLSVCNEVLKSQGMIVLGKTAKDEEKLIQK